MNCEPLERSMGSRVQIVFAPTGNRAKAIRKAFLCLTLLIGCSGLTINLVALAGPEDLRIELLKPGQPQSPPGVPVAPGPLPPIGSGDNPPPLIPGDGGASAGPPSGVADPTTGSKFGTKPEQVIDSTSYQMNVPGSARTTGAARQQPGGAHVVLINNTGGGGTKNITENDLVQMQDAQYPSPYIGKGTVGGKKQLSLDYTQAKKKQDSDPFRLPADSNYLSRKSVLIKVRPFARFLVKLGVVFATVMMITGAWSLLNGHRDGSSKVVGAAGGLILLLMAYTIWKQVMLNTQYFGKYPPQNPDQIYPLPEPNRTNPKPANTPTTPGAVADNRSNMKVKPLGGSVLR